MKKFFTILLLTALLFSTLSADAFAEQNEYKTVVAFGDSLTYGYTVDGNSYAKIYADEKGYTLYNYARIGMTSAELADFLETDLNYSTSDEILLWIGANDLLQTASNYASQKGIHYENMTVGDIELIRKEVKENNFRMAMQKAVDDFAVYLDKILKTIKQNSTGRIFLFTQYNPYSGINIAIPSTGESLNVGLITEEWIEKLNNVITSCENVDIIDTFFAIENAEEKCVNVEINILTNTFNFDPHLNGIGQREVYKSFLKSIEQDMELSEPRQKNPIYIVLSISGILILTGTIVFITAKKASKSRRK